MILPKGERGDNGKYDITYGDDKFKLPSVTTILSVKRSEYLEHLKKEMGAEKLHEVSMKAANRGTIMHMYLENFAYALKAKKDREKALFYSQKKTSQYAKENFTEDECEKGKDFFYNIFHSKFETEFKTPVLIEGLMVSFQAGYAGRTDIIYRDHEDLLVLGDYKSSSFIVLPGSEKEVKFKLQIAAYIKAFEEVYKKTVDYGAVWVAHPQGYQKIVLTKEEFPIYFMYFKTLIRKFQNKENNKINQ